MSMMMVDLAVGSGDCVAGLGCVILRRRRRLYTVALEIENGWLKAAAGKLARGAR